MDHGGNAGKTHWKVLEVLHRGFPSTFHFDSESFAFRFCSEINTFKAWNHHILTFLKFPKIPISPRYLSFVFCTLGFWVLELLLMSPFSLTFISLLLSAPAFMPQFGFFLLTISHHSKLIFSHNQLALDPLWWFLPFRY